MGISVGPVGRSFSELRAP
jgi:glutaredoxin 3